MRQLQLIQRYVGESAMPHAVKIDHHEAFATAQCGIKAVNACKLATSNYHGPCTSSSNRLQNDFHKHLNE